jgi:hypothetical protein
LGSSRRLLFWVQPILSGRSDDLQPIMRESGRKEAGGDSSLSLSLSLSLSTLRENIMKAGGSSQSVMEGEVLGYNNGWVERFKLETPSRTKKQECDWKLVVCDISLNVCQMPRRKL